ncbi:MAG TPA: winged helix-turn-helix transcriptional regulator [Noviherbaspirillum sp.]|jgi:DNA-binding HxlR family transcriptional regulator|uniref:winged helix-turn-helix transcriptional regulator n=1 Tax=Noviherbaspirillum sp. TaxID=1926288 RepID=UPI002DDD642A|nr:winged helix-turn-helix transcriptional regulator [Noviherbaspirillum sp.]HEV2608708.1 winged helix-turn-helix transcriptional regulator [Noviherbaspirillum sp.]
MDESYGQFCTVARGAEALCERWTPLVLRELLCGSKRFNDIHRGVPRMSTSLLVQRLRHLEEIGVVRREPAGKVWEYCLTTSGMELEPVIRALGVWGARWMNSGLRDDELDPGLLMWDMRRSVRPEKFPPGAVVIQFAFHDARRGETVWWLIVEDGKIDLCREDPGRDPNLLVSSSVRAMTEIWIGDSTPQEMIRGHQVRVEGPTRMVESFWGWIGTGTFANTRREASR